MTSLADQRARWLVGHLEWAADTFGVQVDGQPIYDQRLRSAGARVLDNGDQRWLRIVFEDPEWGQGRYLDGNLTANSIAGVPKPSVLRWQEWDDDKDRHFRGELSTYIAERTVADDMLATGDVEIPNSWFDHLRGALDALSHHPVPTGGVDIEDVGYGAQAFFGVTIDPTTITWTTAHCDLHWGNVTAPSLTILDWEIWGRAPAGYDAATLYCTSLLEPALCERVRAVLASYLNTPSGRVATLAAAVRLLRFIDTGEYLPLARPLREHVSQVIS